MIITAVLVTSSVFLLTDKIWFTGDTMCHIQLKGHFYYVGNADILIMC